MINHYKAIGNLSFQTTSELCKLHQTRFKLCCLNFKSK